MAALQEFVYKSRIGASADAVFAWHERPGALERLTPEWLNVKILERKGGLNGGTVVLLLSQGAMQIRWSLKHDQYIAKRQFRDYQVDGPFKVWRHTHKVEPDGPEACFLIDVIEFQLPDVIPMKLIGTFYLKSELQRLFRYRHRLVAKDLETMVGEKKMNVLLSGSTGMIGSALLPLIVSQGHSLTRLVRPETKLPSQTSDSTSTLAWDCDTEELDPLKLEGFDAVVHLAGLNLANGRWSKERKEELRQSRIGSTKSLSKSMAAANKRPKVFVCASAIGYYGNRGPELLTEKSTKGAGFLADLCSDWEAATSVAANAGIRVVNLRLGVVLSPRGGALAKMLLPFELGAGGEIADGKQFFSWITLEDVTQVILHILNEPSLSGPVNATAPNPVTNKEFTKALGKVLFRPTLIPIPTFGLRALLGEMADECLIAGQKVIPEKLEQSGFQFQDKEIEPALRQVLGK